MSKAKVTARAAKAAWSDEPFGWFDDEEMKQAEHPLAVVGRAVQVLHFVAYGVDGEGDMGRVFDGVGTAIIKLAKSKDYESLGWLLYGLEATVRAQYREDWPIIEPATPGRNEDAD